MPYMQLLLRPYMVRKVDNSSVLPTVVLRMLLTAVFLPTIKRNRPQKKRQRGSIHVIDASDKLLLITNHSVIQ